MLDNYYATKSSVFLGPYLIQGPILDFFAEPPTRDFDLKKEPLEKIEPLEKKSSRIFFSFGTNFLFWNFWNI